MGEQPRGFDWGPPSNGGGDTLRELGVYVFLALLLLGGGWVLIDSTGREAETAGYSQPEPAVGGVASMAREPVGRPSPGRKDSGVSTVVIPSKPVAALRPTEEIMPKRFFMIQLGAYGDEESARAAYQKLAGLGFKGSISLPDEQFELYRVVMGPFTSEPEAESLARKLNELEFPCFVIESL